MRNDEKIEMSKAARRRRVAEEISDALRASGMSRKEFAVAMGRQPSEVTKWLSGRHNFTCDLLEEISGVLGVSISGAQTYLCEPGSIHNTVNGYEIVKDESVSSLSSPSAYARSSIDGVDLGVIAGDISDAAVDELVDSAGVEEMVKVMVSIPLITAGKLVKKATKEGLTFREYMSKVLCDKSEEKEFSLKDLCGSCPDFSTAEELRGLRTKNTFPEL